MNKYRYFSDLGLTDFRKYDKLYDEAIVLLDGIVKDYHVSLSQKMNETDEIIKEYVKKLNDEQLEALKKVHGDNLDVTLPRKLFNKMELVNYDRAIRALTKIVENLKNDTSVVEKANKVKSQPIEKVVEKKKIEEEQQKEEIVKKVEEVPTVIYEYTPNDISFKNDMFVRYGYIIENNVLNINFDNVIDESIKKYEDNIDRERFIISEIYNSLKLLIEENKLLKRKIDLLSF